MEKQTVNEADRINEDWLECRISDEDRLSQLEKAFPSKFKKAEMLATLEHARDSLAPARVKADKAAIFGETKTSAVRSPDIKPTTPAVSVLQHKHS